MIVFFATVQIKTRIVSRDGMLPHDPVIGRICLNLYFAGNNAAIPRIRYDIVILLTKKIKIKWLLLIVRNFTLLE
jgi:hypothetical protein